MVPESAGGESFLLGGAEEGSPEAAVRDQTVPLKSRRAATAIRRIRAGTERPVWQGLLVAVACLAVLAAAGWIIWRELKPYLAGNGQEVTRPPGARVSPPATPKGEPAVQPQALGQLPEKAGETGKTATPEGAGTGALPEATSPAPPLEIGVRKDWKAAEPFDPVKAFALDRKKPASKAGEEDDPRSPPLDKGGVGGGLPKAAATKSAATKTSPLKEGTTPELPWLPPPEAAKKNAEPEPPPGPAFEPPPVCALCKGATWLPLQPYAPYVRLGRDAAPDPTGCVPWQPCSKCQPAADVKALAAVEGQRLSTAAALNDSWENQTGMKFEWGETRYVTLRSQLTPAITRHILGCLDKLTQRLQADTKTTLLSMTRPDTHEVIVLAQTDAYNKVVDCLAAQNPGSDPELLKKVCGVIGPYRSFYNAAPRAGGPPPEDMAVFQYAHMLMSAATGAKAPSWLREGFAAYSENLVLTRNLCYTFRYELNQVRFGPNWNAEIRTCALQNKLKPWDQVFPLDLVNMKALDYLTCYSIVFFLTRDPARFVKFITLVRDGLPPAQALEKAYERNLKALQTMWGQWVQTVR
jgi:hypothetical protein